jgi:hypothetical protein
MYFVVTIDTEEDNWGEYARQDYTVENIRRIPALQEVFARYDVRPTYLISYPVATSPMAIDILGSLRVQGHCEIGTHPHPWNTPPVEEDRTPFNSFISHLPSALQYRKIETLTTVIERNFGVRPASYRSGRWGFDEGVAANLIRLGYMVDTSVSPTWTWQPDGGPDFSQCSIDPFLYRLDASPGAAGGSLLEVPATIDFVQSPRRFAHTASRSVRRLPLGNKIAAALARLRVLNHISVSPEIDSAPDMVRLARALLRRGTSVINMFFHSPTLLEGCSPFVRTSSDYQIFMSRLDAFLAFARSAGLQSLTMSELTAERARASRVVVLDGECAA